MYFAKNLQYLRKRDKITQEELADRLGVSRQSVSKWETGEAYPETDTLILLCDLFGESLDRLLRSDVTADASAEKFGETPVETAADQEPQPFTDGREYSAQVNRFSRAVAFGVFLVLLGVAVCVALTGVSFLLGEKLRELTATFGGVAVVAFVAVAVFLFMFGGMRYDKFRKEHPVMGEVFDEREISAFTKKFTIVMPCLISGILLDAVYLIVFTTLIDQSVIAVSNADAAYCFVTAVFLAVLAVLAGGIVWLGIQHGKYRVDEYNKQSAERGCGAPARSKLKDAVCGAVMMTATAVFLVLGFVCGWWHPGWVVFPVGGIICGIIGAFMDAKDDHKNK